MENSRIKWPLSLTLRGFLIAVATLISLTGMAVAANYNINNPADKINNPASKIANPADKIYNPSSNINNPASTVTNPAAQLTNPSPLSVAQPAVKQAEQVTPGVDRRLLPVVEKKYYTFKKVKEYINAAKKAFVKDDYPEFIAIAEDALQRINSGSLRASVKTKNKLNKYREFGYSLMVEGNQ